MAKEEKQKLTPEKEETKVTVELTKEQLDALNNINSLKEELTSEKEKIEEEKQKLAQEKDALEIQLKEISDEELKKESLSVGKELLKEKKVTIVVPISELNPKDLIVPVTINGYTYVIKRGEEVEVPQTVKDILKEAKYI